MAENFYHLEIESDPNNLLTVEEFVNYFARDINLKEEKIPGLLLAVTEATTNAILHGNKGDNSKNVTIDVKVESNRLIICIKDEGKGFDPSDVPDPTHPDNLLKDSGRGLYLMRVYMDDLQYKNTPTGTETILVLNL
ncbi:MAG: ATP-binding protein [Ignavibacteriaceae bacterium]